MSRPPTRGMGLAWCKGRMPRPGVILSIALILFAAEARAGFCERQMAYLLPKDPARRMQLTRDVERLLGIFQTREGLEGKVTWIGNRGSRVYFKVGKRIGAGSMGIVYHAEISDYEPGSRAAFPALFSGKDPRSDLVLKFPRGTSVPVLSLANLFFQRQLHQEGISTGKINETLVAMGLEPIPGSTIYAERRNGAGDVPLPFLVKPFVRGETPRGPLTDEQTNGLRKIFTSAHRLYSEKGILLDIKPTNLVWDADKREWGMYEITVGTPSAASFVEGGFPNYVSLFANR